MNKSLTHRFDEVLYIPLEGELYETLADFGQSVTSVKKRISTSERQREKENFCLRRLLVAWEKTGSLLRPLRISRHSKADYSCYDQHDKFLFTIEVTEAVQKEYAYALANSIEIPAEENSQVIFLKTNPDHIGKFKNPEENSRYQTIVGRETRGWLGHEPENRIEDDIIDAIDRKIKKGSSGEYGNKSMLLIYDRSEASIVCGNQSKVISHLLQRSEIQSFQSSNIFDQVHYLSGSKIFLDILNPLRNAEIFNVELREQS